MTRRPDVLFTEPDEFVAEIARDHARGLVERGIVRLTKVGRPAMNGTLTAVSVEAAAIVEGRCVRLRRPCGDLWGHPDDDRVQTAASELVRSLEEQLLDAGLELRAGLFQD